MMPPAAAPPKAPMAVPCRAFGLLVQETADTAQAQRQGMMVCVSFIWLVRFFAHQHRHVGIFRHGGKPYDSGVGK